MDVPGVTNKKGVKTNQRQGRDANADDIGSTPTTSPAPQRCNVLFRGTNARSPAKQGRYVRGVSLTGAMAIKIRAKRMISAGFSRGHGGCAGKVYVYMGIQIFYPKTELGFETNDDDHNRVSMGWSPRR